MASGVTHEQKLALAVIRFANHAEDRRLKLPLWASLLWDDVIGLAREVELPDPDRSDDSR